MSIAEKKLKDSKMAAAMKKAGIERTPHKGHQRCPVCNNIVSNSGFYAHIMTHK